MCYDPFTQTPYPILSEIVVEVSKDLDLTQFFIYLSSSFSDKSG